ncbi:ABC transporter permease [Enterovibrio norvegicus]|uniref:ABC-2 type transport system permease protein n=1 Tax=Enterovibrio norvegicus DSM 15893 TaxID=1121869 RepID=A0A1I5LYD5_9GAMM|nr:ABC transporter permease [Enterovibrio norvegicus]SFP02394.1 ABC-2 type transport system permease protein [Enterovibrio norvegicus DSM 15893]
MKNTAFTSLLWQEWRLIASDRWLAALLGGLPLVMFLLVWAIFSSGTGRDLPIGVVDLDNSALSRSLVRYYDATPTLAIRTFDDVDNASASLNSAKTYATVVIPYDFEKATKRGENPNVTAFYNSQYILIGKLVNSALNQAQSTFSALVATQSEMLHGTTVATQAAGLSVPLRFQLVPLFNAGTNYAQFLVSAIVPALWQITLVASGMLSMALTDKRIGLETYFNGAVAKKLTVKVLGTALPLWLLGIGFATGMHWGLGWPMNGDWAILLTAQWLMVLAGLAVGTLLYVGSRDAVRAMSLVAGFTAPAFAFMGVSFPAGEMPFLAQCWRAMLPVSHYITLQIGQFNYGATLQQSMPALLALASFSLIWLLIGLKMKRLSTNTAHIQSVDASPSEVAS